MSDCRLSWNGKPSVLYPLLSQKYGQQVADQVMTYVNSLEFSTKFGDYKEGLSKVELDQEGQEPTLEWLEKNVEGMFPKVDSQEVKPITTTSSELIKISEPKEKVKQSDVQFDLIRAKVKAEVIQKALDNPTVEYKLSITNPGASKYPDNNGVKDIQYAHILDDFRREMGKDFPSNLKFFPAFEFAMNASPGRRTALYAKVTDQLGSNIGIDQDMLTEMALKMEIATVDDSGLTTGTFSKSFGSNLQLDAADSLLGVMYDTYLRVPTTSVNTLLRTALLTAQGEFTKAESKGDTAATEKWKAIYTSFSFPSNDGRLSFLDLLLERFKALGFVVKEDVANQLRDKYATDKWDLDLVKKLNTDKVDIEESNNLYPTFSVEDLEIIDKYDEFMNQEVQRAKGVQDWSDSSFEVDFRDTASVRLKMWLSSQNKMTRDEHGLKPALNELGMPSKVNLDNLYTQLMSRLASTSNLELESAIDILESSDIPDLVQVAQNLKQAPVQTQNEFIKVMSLQYGEWVLVSSKVTENSEGRQSTSNRIINAQRGAQKQTIIEHWKAQNTLSPMTLTRPDGVKVMNTERAKQHLAFIQAYSLLNDYWKKDSKERLTKEFDQYKEKFGDVFSGTLEDLFNDTKPSSKLNEEGVSVKDYSTQRSLIGSILQKMFKEYGINLNDAMIKNLTGTSFVKKEVTDKIKTMTKGTKLEGSFLQQFSFSKDVKPKGIFSAFFGKASGYVLGVDMDSAFGEEEDNLIMANHPMYSEGTTMSVLASVAANHSDALYSNVHKNLEGKTISDYSMNTALSSQVQKLTQDFDSVVNELSKATLLNSGKDEYGTPLFDSSWYMQQWLSNRDSLPELKYIEGLNYNNAKKGTTRAGMSDREQYLTSISLFFNQGSDKAHYFSLTHSDKTMTPVFYGIPKINVGSKVHELSVIPKNVQEAFAGIVKGEHRRALVVQSVKDTGDKKINDGGTKFFFFEEFNQENLKKSLKEVGIHPDEIDQVYSMLYTGTGHLAQDIEPFTPYIERIIAHKLKGLIEAQKEEWSKNDITYELLDSGYIKRLHKKLDEQSADNRLSTLSRILKDKNKTMLARREEIIMDHAVKDYTINHLLWNMNTALLFYGDPAQCYKKSVEGTHIEYAKRLAKDIAPGQDLAWGKLPRSYKAITLSDVTEAYDYITKHGSNVTSSDGTDAQEFTTVQEHLDVMFAAGLLEEDFYNSMSGKIKEAGPGGYYEFTSVEVSKLGKQGLQPMKPVYAGFRPVDKNGLRLYDYVKSSSYPLLPQFTKGTEMDKVRVMMETQGIQRANYISAKKIGGPTTTLSVFSKEGVATIPGTLPEGVVQTLHRENFRIQQDVPYDEEKDHIKVVSQMNKLITEGIVGMDGFKIGDTSYTGKQLRAKKEELRGLMYKKNLAKLMVSLGSTRVKGNLGWYWGEIDRRKLIGKLVDTAKERGYSQNEINLLEQFTDDGDFAFPPFLHPAFEKFESLLMSMVNKVSETKIPGKSYVQTSSTGYRTFKTEDEIDKSQVVYVGDYDGSEPLKHMQIAEDGSVIPAQVYAPFNFTYTVKGNTVIAKVEDFLLREGDEGYKPGRKQLNHTKVPKELLQLIGARIPNQGHNSMIPIEIVGFVPKEMSDTLIVPSAITGQMGSDFDVDKLYTYKRPYKYNSLTKSFEVIQAPTKKERLDFEDNYQYKETGDEEDYRDISQSEMDSVWAEKVNEDKLAREYVDIHWAVLTHPEMYTRILNKLDKPDLTDNTAAQNKEKYGIEVEGLNRTYTTKPSTISSFWSVQTQLGSFQSGKDAKALVGMTSLAVTFNSVIQDKKLQLGHFEYEKGKEDAQPRKDYLLLNGMKFSKLSGNGKGLNGYSKQDNHTIFQSGAVDNAKDRTLDNLNISIATYPAIQVLHQLETDEGLILGTDFSIGMMVQDIIWDYSKGMRAGNDSLTEKEDFATKLSEKVIKDLKAEYASRLQEGEEYKEGEVIFDLTAENLEKLWKEKDKNSTRYIKSQLQVLEMFEKLSKYGERLTQIQKTLNQDTNGAGPNILYAMQQSFNYDGLFKETLGKIFLGEDSLVKSDTEQSTAFGSTIPTVLGLAKNLIPIDAIRSVVTTVAESQGKDFSELSETAKRDVIRSMRSAMLASSPTISENNQAERVKLLYGTGTKPSLAVRLEEYKTSHRSNYFLNRLSSKINTMGKGPDFISFENAKAIRMDEAMNLSDFTKLLLSENEVESDLAKDLIKYALLLTPQNGPQSFVTKVPAGVLLGSNYGYDMRNSMEELKDTGTISNFLQQLYQHNPSLAVEIKKDVLDLNLPSNRIEGRAYPEVLSLSYEDIAESSVNLSQDDEIIEAPYLRFYDKQEGKTILYKKQNAAGEYIQYQRIDTLGTKTNVEYDLRSTGVLRSIFSNNSAGFEFNEPSVEASLLNQVNLSILQSPGSSDALTEYGLTENSTHEDLTKALKLIEADRRVPLYYRTVAASIGAGSNTDVRGTQFKLKVDEGFKKAAGSYHVGSNTMILAKGLGRVEAVETLLHELQHKHTNEILWKLGYSDEATARENYVGKEPFEEWWPKYQRGVIEFARLNPRLVNQVKEIDRLRHEALLAFQNRVQEEGGTSDDYLIAYGLENIYEFIAMVPTNKVLMNFLNSVESSSKEDKRTFFRRLADALINFFVEVSRFLGQDVKEGSLLHEAYGLVYHFNSERAKESIRLEDARVVPTTLFTPMENEAVRLQDVAQNVYGQETTLTNDGSHFAVNITTERVKNKFTSQEPRVQEALDKMQKQLRILDSSLLSKPILTEEDKEKNAYVRHLYNEILEDAKNLEATKDLKSLADLGTKQMNWVRKIINSDTPHAQEVVLAYTLIDMWTGLDTMYDGKLGQVDKEFDDITSKLIGEAKQLYAKVHQFNVATLLKKTEDSNSPLTLEDFGVNLKDQNGLRKIGSLVDDMNPLIQHLSSTVQQAIDNVTESGKDLTYQLRSVESKLKEYAKANGLSLDTVFKKFIQENEQGNAFGLVQKLGANWFKGNADTYRGLRRAIEKLDKLSEKEDSRIKKGRGDRYKDSFKDFWDSMNRKEAKVVNVSLLFDLTTGERLGEDSTHYQKSLQHYQELLDHTGDQSIVDEAIEDTQKILKSYLEDKESKRNDIWRDVELTLQETLDADISNEQKLKLTPEEQVIERERLAEEALNSKRENLLRSWMNRNSPAAFIQTKNLEVIDSKYFRHSGNNAPRFVPKKGSEVFDKKYDHLQSNPVLKEAYDTYVELSKEFRGYHPPSVADELHPNFLPVIKLSDMASTMDMVKGIFQGKLGQAILNSVSIDEYQKNVKYSDEIPLKYSSNRLPTKDGEVDLSNVSMNLTQMFSMWGGSSIHYRYMSQVRNDLEIVKRLVQDISTKRTQEGEKDLKNLSESLKYYEDQLVFQKGMNPEGVMTDPVYSWNPVKNASIKRKVADLNTELQKVKDEIWAEMGNAFGGDDEELTNKKLEELEKKKKGIETELSELTKDVRFLAGSKAATTMMTLAQLKAMAYNPFSIVSNMSQGLLQASVYARGFRIDKEDGTSSGDFTIGQFRKGLKIVGSRSNKTKIVGIMDSMGLIDVLLDQHMPNYSKMDSVQKAAVKKLFDPFAGQRFGDFFHKSAMVVAMMLNKKVDTKEGSITLFDAMDSEGHWDVERLGENKDWYSRKDKDLHQKEWNKFRSKVKAVSIRVHGHQDPNVPMFYKNSTLGRLIGQFRASWMLAGYDTRLQGQYYNQRLDRVIEGRWRTYTKLKGFGVPLLLKQVASVVTGQNAFEGVETEQIDDEGNRVMAPIQEHEIVNMRQNLAGLSYTLAAGAAVMLLRGALPSAEERKRRKAKGLDKSDITRIAMNLMIRSQQDLTVYGDPSTLMQLTGHAVPSATVITDYMNAVKAFGLLVKDDPKKWEKFILKQTKAWPYLNNWNRLQFYMTRDIAATQH